MDDSDDGLISKEELMRANYISKANLSESEIEQILSYV
jgi:Ca2+-binding EF-hand superfamily protein